MPGPTIEGDTTARKPSRPNTSIHTGVVMNNCDLLGQGKVLVRIPDLNQEVWARMTGTGGGAGTGFFHNPNPDDEVLIALDQSNPAQAYVIGGLWSSTDRPPVDVPVVNTARRVYRTGLPKAPAGHEMSFDDATQIVTVTTSTKQKLVMAPDSIELSTTGGTVSLTLDLKTQSISLKGVAKIDLSAQGEISLTAAKISINGTVQTDIKGGIVTIN